MLVQRCIAAATIACCGLPMLVVRAQTVVHVSPSGDDAADGSQARPLRTIHEAQRRARDVHAARVEIAAGEYELDEPLVFTPADSGESAEAPMKYAAVDGNVVLSGGRRIGPWRVEGDHWVADVPLAAKPPTDDSTTLKPFRDLWVNGRRAIRARTPNEGYFRVEAAGPDNRTSFVVAAADLQTLAKPQAAEVGFMHDWSMSRVRLAAIDAATRTYSFAAPIGAAQSQFAISNFEPNPRYFLENAREFLDAPGEWFLDEAAGKIYYVPREAETPETAEAIAPRLEQLLIVLGENGKPVEHLNFSGLTFSHCRFDLPPFGYAGVQSCWHSRRSTPDDDAGVTMTAAVLVDQARDCEFTRCRFEHLAACGVHLTRCQDCRISRSIVRDVGGDGVLIGSRDRLETPPASNISVANCLIEHCGVNFFGAVGLWIGFAENATVSQNEIRHLPYTGISVGWQWDDEPTICRGHIIRQNRIHHVMNELSDGGGIYTLGRQRGTQLTGNVIHDVPLNSGRAESNGIFMDQGSTEIEVAGNTIYNLPRGAIRFHMAGSNALKDNRLVVPPGVPAFTYNATDAALMTFTANEEIAAASWEPPPGDAVVERAGPRHK